MRSLRCLEKLVSASWAPYASVLTVAGLAACSSAAGPGGPEPSPHAAAASAAPQGAASDDGSLAPGRRLISGHVTPEMKNAPVVGRVDPATPMTLLFSLPVKDLEGLRADVARVADPRSPAFRKYLTPEAFGEKYGASAAEYQELVDWAKAKGFEVSPHPNRLALRATAAAADVETALQVRLVRALREDGSAFFMPDAEPSIDRDLHVERVGGLDDFHVQKHADATGDNGGYSARDLEAAYTACPSAPAHAGQGQLVGLYIPGGAFLQSDVNIYAAKSGLPKPNPIARVPLGSFSGSADVEPSIDVQMVTALAPEAHIVVFTDTDDTALQAMAARPDIKQFSSSYFPAAHASGQAALLEMALQGQSFFNASGDSGGLAPNDNPTDIRSQDPVTSVGGTVLAMNGAGLSYQSEWAWNGSSGWILTDGTKGVPIPPYQAGLATSANGASATYRNIPDVALMATNATIYRNGSPEVWGGTSVASPLWAGFAALINQLAAENDLPSLGFPNPVLYHVARTSRGPWDFHDITSGSTGRFSATAGYDLATGLGSPKCALIADLEDPRLVVPPTSDVLLQDNRGNVEIWRMRDTAVAANGYVGLGSATSDRVLKGSGDFDGDGQGDIFWRNSTTGDTEAWLVKNGAVSAYSPTGNITSDWSFQGTGDFNNDGTSDVLWRNSAGTVETWEMRNGGPLAYVGMPSANWSWTIQGIGDFDGDGTSDILWRNTNGAVAIWRIVNGAVAAYWDPGSADSTWSIQGVGDFDGDGKSDILWRNNSGGLEFWKMAGGVATAYVGIGSATWDWSVQAVGDFNDDGVSDILWKSWSTGDVEVWQMSTSTITFHGIGNLSSAWTVKGTLVD